MKAPSTAGGKSTGVDVGATPERMGTQPTPSPEEDGAGTVRRRTRTVTWGKKSIGAIMAEAHRQDFEKRRKRLRRARLAAAGRGAIADDDDDDDDDAGRVMRMKRRRESSVGGGGTWWDEGGERKDGE